MSSEYNNSCFSQFNNDVEFINYNKFNKNKTNSFIKCFPKNLNSYINSPIYLEIHKKHNPHSKSLKLFDTYDNNYNYIQYYKPKSDHFNFDSPDMFDCQITVEDDFSPHNFTSNPNKILHIINERNIRARSPKMLRNNYFHLNDKYDSNNDIMAKSNSQSRIFNKNPSGYHPMIKQKIMNNNPQILKDSSSLNNIHPMRIIQFKYSPIKSNNIKRVINKNLLFSSRYDNNNSNIIFKKNNYNSENTYSFSTMASKSPNSIKYKNISNCITKFSNNKSNANTNKNSQCLNKKNIKNFNYTLESPKNNNLNNFHTILKDNENCISSEIEFNNYFSTKDNNNIYSFNNDILSIPKLYKPKFTKINHINSKPINTDRGYNQKNLLNIFSDSEIDNFNPEIYANQYSIQRSRSPKRIQYQNKIIRNLLNNKKNNTKPTLNSKRNNFKIQSCLPKLPNYSHCKNNSKPNFSSNFDDSISFNNSLGFNSNENINPINKILNNYEISLFNIDNDMIKSSVKNKKLNKEDRPSDNFSKYIFEGINKIRGNPHFFIQTIKNEMHKITQNRKGNLYYNGELKVALCKGKIAFEEAINFLEKSKPMKPLIYKRELCVEIPKNEKDFESSDYLRTKINKMIMKGITVRAFWKDIIKNPKIDFLLMIIDDNYIKRGAKRKDILNPDMKYIGINSGSKGQHFVSYIVLSDE